MFLDFEEVKPLIGQPNALFEVDNKWVCVRLSDIKWRMFDKNNACVCCGIVGNKAALINNITSHSLKLCAIYGNFVVEMTKDHVIPKCKKGPSGISNLQTMCSLCNHMKGHSKLSLEKQRQKLRQLIKDGKRKDPSIVMKGQLIYNLVGLRCE